MFLNLNVKICHSNDFPVDTHDPVWCHVCLRPFLKTCEDTNSPTTDDKVFTTNETAMIINSHSSLLEEDWSAGPSSYFRFFNAQHWWWTGTPRRFTLFQKAKPRTSASEKRGLVLERVRGCWRGTVSFDTQLWTGEEQACPFPDASWKSVCRAVGRSTRSCARPCQRVNKWIYLNVSPSAWCTKHNAPLFHCALSSPLSRRSLLPTSTTTTTTSTTPASLAAPSPLCNPCHPFYPPPSYYLRFFIWIRISWLLDISPLLFIFHIFYRSLGSWLPLKGWFTAYVAFVYTFKAPQAQLTSSSFFLIVANFFLIVLIYIYIDMLYNNRITNNEQLKVNWTRKCET